MKVKVLFVGISLIIGSSIIVGFVNKKNSNKRSLEVKKVVKKTSNRLNCFSSESFNKYPEVVLNYLVRGANNKTLTKSKINKVKTLEDVIEHFPSNWIREYISVEIERTTQNIKLKEIGKSIKLTPKQQELFNNARIGDDLIIKVLYKSNDSLEKEAQVKEINVTMTVVPEVEAKFKTGNEKLTQYFEENSNSEILNWKFNPMQNAVASFIINEKGETVNVKIIKTTGIITVDRAIIELLYKMPKWNPAKNNKGELVKQEFEFSIGEIGC